MGGGWDCHVTYSQNNFCNTDNSEYSQLDYSVTPFISTPEDEIWAHDKTGSKHIYKKGFDSFLRNREGWKLLL